MRLGSNNEDGMTPEARTRTDEVSLQTATGTLFGTLICAGKIAALVIAGSGPTDRDGNSALNLRSNAYRMLAEGLEAAGISTLRYDKRGVGASQAAITDEKNLRFQTYVDDARAWAHELTMQIGVKSIWLIGHSEGALIAERAAENNAGVCGLVLVSGAGRTDLPLAPGVVDTVVNWIKGQPEGAALGRHAQSVGRCDRTTR